MLFRTASLRLAQIHEASRRLAVRKMDTMSPLEWRGQITPSVSRLRRSAALIPSSLP